MSKIQKDVTDPRTHYFLALLIYARWHSRQQILRKGDPLATSLKSRHVQKLQGCWALNNFKCRSEHSLPPANEVWGKIMFSQVFVCPRGCLLNPPCRQTGGICPTPTPWMQTPPGCGPSGCRPSWMQNPPPQKYMGYDGMRSTSGQYAFYWNAFLF